MSSESLFPNIPSQWTVTTLGELAKASGGDIQTGPFGSQLHASDYVDDGVPSIMPKNISVDAITTDDIARVSPEDVKRLSKYKVQVGDIVYSRRGDVEKCARITEKEDGWLCGTGCLRVRVKPSIVSPEYLHAYLCHPTVREWIVRHAVGATMPNLNTSILSALPVVIPSNSEMTTIGSIWLTISDKIQLNGQINQTLEQMAQAIFKSWFVDFDPVKAKIAALEAGGSEEDALVAAMQAISGKGEAELTRLQAEQPDQYVELRATAELFPSAMQDSELGEIPEGWDHTSLGSIISLDSGFPYKGKNKGHGENQIVTMGCVSPHGRFEHKGAHLYDGEFKASHKVRGGDICISSHDVTQAREHLGAPFIVPDDLGALDVAAATNTFIVRRSYSFSREFIFQTFRSQQFRQEMFASAKGTAILHISKKAVLNFKFSLPSSKILECFDALVNPMVRQIEINAQECHALAQTRDTLLPKLLSGELSVAGTEDQVAERAEPANV